MADSSKSTANDVSSAATPGRTGSTAASIAVLVLILLGASALVFLPSPPACRGREGQHKKSKGPEPIELAIGIPGFNGRLDGLRAWAKLAWMELRRPSEEARSAKGAAKESFKMAKGTAEKAAAEAVEKVKRKVSLPQPSSSDVDL